MKAWRSCRSGAFGGRAATRLTDDPGCGLSGSRPEARGFQQDGIVALAGACLSRCRCGARLQVHGRVVVVIRLRLDPGDPERMRLAYSPLAAVAESLYALHFS